MPKSDASEELLAATYRALCQKGYASLTVEDIAREADKSTSLIHYHYDTKADLMIALIDRLLDSFAERVQASEDRPPVERLVEFIGWFVLEAGGQRESFHVALLGVRSQGPYDDRIRAELVRSDQLLRETVVEILHEGFAEGVFERTDPETTALLLIATLDGGRTRQVSVGDEGYTREVAEAALRQIVDPLLSEGVERPSLADVGTGLESTLAETTGQ